MKKRRWGGSKTEKKWGVKKIKNQIDRSMIIRGICFLPTKRKGYQRKGYQRKGYQRKGYQRKGYQRKGYLLLFGYLVDKEPLTNC